MKFSKEKLIEMLRKMLEIRHFEESIHYVYAHGWMPGLAHLYIGQEAIAVGVCENLEKDDYITSTHRGHGHLIAKGGDLNKMMAEVMGKVTGYCKGKGGSMHIAAPELGIMGANGIVGGSIPIATGLGLSSKLKRDGRVTICFFGEGASNQGAFHEGLNMGSLWNLPIVYICENNLYAISVSQQRSQNIEEYTIPIGKADIKREGKDITIIASSSMVMESLVAAEKLAKEGVIAEVIDLRSLVPMDKTTIINSVKKTGRLVIVDEGVKQAGITAEIATMITEEAFDFLDGPIERIANENTPIPFSSPLEEFVRPTQEKIYQSAKKILK